MKFDYNRSLATAHRLIDRFGTMGAIRRYYIDTPGFDPSRMATDYPCTLVQLNYNNNEIGELIRQTDKKVYVSPVGLSISPTIADTCLIGGEEHQIINVTVSQPSAGIIVYFDLQCRR